MMMRRSTSSGFTLVELSIVIVIIGLLIGSVVAGKALMEVARINKIISYYTEYETAFNSFKIKYNALPGDMANASGQLAYPEDRTILANNGNGDGMIGWVETIYIWQHLSFAGIIPPAPYSAAQFASNGVDSIQLGVTNPRLSIDDKHTFNIAYATLQSTGGNRKANYLSYGFDSDNWWFENGGAGTPGALTGRETKVVDEKLDDGRPFSGRVITNWNFIVCTNSDVNINTYEANKDYDIPGYSYCSAMLELDPL